MAAHDLEEIMRQVDRLSPDESRQLLEYLTQKTDQSGLVVRAGRSWLELEGIAPGLMGGEDAQEWVSRTRRESDESREKQLRRQP